MADNTVKKVLVAHLLIDASVQAREADAARSEEAISEYAEKLRAGIELDPIDVFGDGDAGGYYIGDGFHRARAAVLAKCVSLLARTHEGGRLGALRWAVGANQAHGLRRTNADKRRAVYLALTELGMHASKATNAKVAEVCGVGDDLVAEVRAPMDKQCSENEHCDKPAPAVRVRKDGKLYTVRPCASAPRKNKPAPVNPAYADGFPEAPKPPPAPPVPEPVAPDSELLTRMSADFTAAYETMERAILDAKVAGYTMTSREAIRASLAALAELVR